MKIQPITSTPSLPSSLRILVRLGVLGQVNCVVFHLYFQWDFLEKNDKCHEHLPQKKLHLRQNSTPWRNKGKEALNRTHVFVNSITVLKSYVSLFEMKKVTMTWVFAIMLVLWHADVEIKSQIQIEICDYLNMNFFFFKGWHVNDRKTNDCIKQK